MKFNVGRNIRSYEDYIQESLDEEEYKTLIKNQKDQRKKIVKLLHERQEHY